MSTLYDSYSVATDYDALFGSSDDNWLSQSFTPSVNYTIGSVKLYLEKGVGTVGNVTVAIYTADANHYPTGAALATGTTPGDTLTTDDAGEEREITFSTPTDLTSGTVYCIVVRAITSDNTLEVKAKDSGTYSGGKLTYSNNGGVAWNQYGGNAKDALFKTYGTATLAPPVSDAYVTKKLVEVGSDEVWYESTPGTMSVLAASIGQLDTSDFLTTCEAFGKVFIANGSNLKVADFINTKIATADVVPGGAGVAPPDFGTVLTGGTSDAKMVVDYITALDGACTIYGKRTTTATFSSAEVVTGTDDDGNGISFTMTAAAEVAPPHWYSWTRYGNSSTFGVMPAKANLVCRYRGRLVLSGNKNYPHQWYMSKVANPWNWVYSTTDPLTAVAGNNTDAGEVGDTVQALIPYGDDFLLFGCSGSIHLMDGDPAFGGSIDEKCDYTGIYGAHAWCKDNLYNLHFFGSNGIYKMDGGRSLPQNISSLSLPNLVSDWSPNQATKRIVMFYDPDNAGIVTIITTLATGVNLGYFYSLKTEGFYPESYPSACGVFSSYYYEATNSTYSGLLLGCNDGYLRTYLASAKDDDSGATDTAISSYLVLAPFPMSEDLDKYGKLQTLTFELSGGAAAGDFTDTDGMSYALYKGDDAETIIEDIKDAATAFTSGTLTGTGRKNKIRPRMRSTYLGLKLYNSTAAQTWGVNKIYGNILPAGGV